MKVNQDVDRGLVQVALDLRLGIERFAHPRIAEIVEQQQSLFEVRGQDLAARPARSARATPRWPRTAADPHAAAAHPSAPRAVHRHGSGNSGGSWRRRPAAGSSRFGPAVAGKEIRCGVGRNHRGGHRPSHAAGTSAVKARAPSSATSSDRASACGHASAPACSGHSTISTPSSPNVVQSELLEIRWIFDAVEVDVPDRRTEQLIGLDDGEAGAWHLAVMAKRRRAAPEPAWSCRPTEGPDRVMTSPGAQNARQLASEGQRRLFVLEPHCGARGMVSVTLVPLPRADSSSTVPPCASMNCRVSGRPRPSAASPRVAPDRWKRANTCAWSAQARCRGHRRR